MIREALKEFLCFMLVLLGLVALVLASAAPRERYVAPIEAIEAIDEPDQLQSAAASDAGEDVKPPELFVAPCELGPKTVPILPPERTA